MCMLIRIQRLVQVQQQLMKLSTDKSFCQNIYPPFKSGRGSIHQKGFQRLKPYLFYCIPTHFRHKEIYSLYYAFLLSSTNPCQYCFPVYFLTLIKGCIRNDTFHPQNSSNRFFSIKNPFIIIHYNHLQGLLLFLYTFKFYTSMKKMIAILLTFLGASFSSKPADLIFNLISSNSCRDSLPGKNQISVHKKLKTNTPFQGKKTFCSADNDAKYFVTIKGNNVVIVIGNIKITGLYKKDKLFTNRV